MQETSDMEGLVTSAKNREGFLGELLRVTTVSAATLRSMLGKIESLAGEGGEEKIEVGSRGPSSFDINNAWNYMDRTRGGSTVSGGHIPSFNISQTIKMAEKRGALAGGYRPGTIHRGPNLTTSGGPAKVVMNSAEHVSNFAGKTWISPPKN